MKTIILPAILVLLAGFARPPQDQDQADTARIDRLVRDLGDSAKRDEAVKELHKIGKPAVPALQKAARDKDADRAMAARGILLDLLGKDQKSASGSDVQVVYHDWSRGVYFVKAEDGHITLTVPEKDGQSGKQAFKTYEADSLEQFKKEHPDLAKKYDVDKMASPEALSREMQQEWQAMKRELGIDGGDEQGMETWMQRQQQRMDQGLHDWDQHAATRGEGHGLGVLVSTVPPALQSQLKLEESKGLLVVRVQPDSLAQRSGLRAYDILLRLNKQPIQDVASFRKDLEKALTESKFSLEILRGGKRSTIDVTPQAPAK